MSLALAPAEAGEPSSANRLAYLDDYSEPYYPSQNFPKLTTPQWIGDAGVEVVVTFGIDDMSNPKGYETFLRPILERLKQIDGRAPVSIFSTAPQPDDPQLQQWLKEGLNFEVHTLSHPCPILGQHNFAAAEKTFLGCVELLNHIPGNRPVAFRTPCCDSIDSASPRLFSEVVSRTNAAGQFVRMDSSIAMILSTNDPSLPRDLLLNANGGERFRRYVPFAAFSTTIENYPYPYVQSRFLWEMPFVVPSDWESQNVQGSANPKLLEDWTAALDLIALKQGTFNFILHPYGWSASTQHVQFIDQAISKHGSKIKFLNYQEVHEQITKNLLAGQPLRAANGQDNGVRLMDLDNDGYLDVVIGNERVRTTRVWDASRKRWKDSEFPVSLITTNVAGNRVEAGVRFGLLGRDQLVMLVRNEREAGAWRFESGAWVSDPGLLKGLELDGQPVFTARQGRDRGVRLRDVDNNGACELIVANETQNVVFQWAAKEQTWKRQAYGLPEGAAIVNADGQDNGVRFVDLNGDGADDIIFSNEEAYSIHLMVPAEVLGFARGWSREVLRGSRGQAPEVPMIVRGGAARNNGAWFAHGEMWVQNEDTAHLPNSVQHYSFADLMSGLQPRALSPTQSLATLQVPAGFTVELVAAEPLVKDPVRLDWGEDGKLWVVEMADYPLGIDGKGKPGGRVRFLEDTDGDGRYDKSTIFAENLNFPNGLLPWRKGVLVSAAPDILYLEDTDGDGKADKIEKLFTGFGEGNQQHRENGFEYGLDNWVYGANGDSGGSIKSASTGQSTSISGRDFRFQPDTGAFEAIAGHTQYGRHRDDWGNWFGNANPIWLWHYWLPEHYIKRNPRLSVERTSREVATYPDAGRVYPIGRKQQRMNDIGSAGHVTSANSPTPNRDDLFGDAFANVVFISEPVYNLVRCEILHPEGVSFTSTRLSPDKRAEFLASSDPWFRPTGQKIGPDGALYIADMYRQFIEHPEWIPHDIQRRVNLRAGEDMGRIYRVYPKGATLRPPPRLDRFSTLELVQALDHPNGWQRDTAQRLLVARGDVAAVAPLHRLAAKAENPKARLHALCTLDGLGALQPDDLVHALNDSSPGVRENAIRLSEGSLRGEPPPALANALTDRVSDENLRVRFQVALSLGEWNNDRAAHALARLALRDAQRPDVITAIMSSSTHRPAALLTDLFAAHSDLGPLERLTSHLVTLTMSGNDPSQLALILEKLATPAGEGGQHAPWQITAFAQMLQETEKSKHSPAELKLMNGALPSLLATARAIVTDNSKPVPNRAAALALLGRDQVSEAKDVAVLTSLLQPQSPPALGQAALFRLGQLQGDSVPRALLRDWKGLTAVTRDKALEVLLRRERWVGEFLDHLEAGEVTFSDLGASSRQRLLTHPNESMRKRARKLLAMPVSADKQRLIAGYLPDVQRSKGEVQQGANLFTRNCAVCHRLRGEWNGAAPDLASVVDRSPERMLIAILDPNRAVEDRYLAYVARTKSGDEVSGILIGESANSVTLVSASGTQETILRGDIASLASSRLSLMPEGFEQLLKPQDIADLIAYLDANSTPPRSFPGNQPAVVQRDANGALRLRASNAELYGDGIEFESHYENLGSWNGQNARAVWTVEVPADGEYDIWLHWACQSSEAGDGFRFQIGDATATGKVPGTGTWDTYQDRKFARVGLSAGKNRAAIQAESPLKGYLMDLVEIRLVPAVTSEPSGFDGAIVVPPKQSD